MHEMRRRALLQGVRGSVPEMPRRVSGDEAVSVVTALARLLRGQRPAPMSGGLLVVVVAVRLLGEVAGERGPVDLATDRSGKLPDDAEAVVRAAIA